MGQEPYDTKTQLFFAAVHVFAEKGYKAATVRDICKRANAANLNAVNYYFGGKEGLYGTVLSAMFSELGKRWDEVDAAAPHDLTPAQRLKHYIDVYCSLLYAEDDLSGAFTSIFLSEMVRPCALLKGALASSVKPQTERFMNLISQLLGPGADETTLRRCFVSVLGPLLYPAIVLPAADSFFESSVMRDLKGFVNHAHRFAMAGIAAMKDELQANSPAKAQGDGEHQP